MTKPLYIKTPVLHSQRLKNQFQQDIYFKLEALQPAGSFKIRGIGLLCQHYVQQGYQSFVASSGGNAGIAVAYCGQKLQIPTTIFIPITSHAVYIDEIKSYGAEVVVAGNVWDEAQQAALAYVKQQGAAYIPPFDHPLIWEGHATLVDELKNQIATKPDVIIAAVGGGGLSCGILQGLHQNGWQDVPLITVGTQGADAFYQSMQANKRVILPAITSRATSIGVKQVAQQLFDWRLKHEIKAVVVTDDEAEQGARAFAQDKRILVELSAGAALSLVYTHHDIIQPYQNIVVVVCGGVNTRFFNLEPI
jgi:L-serine/L-threonine ammonia-lyase